jgi:hypothetical protein
MSGGGARLTLSGHDRLLPSQTLAGFGQRQSPRPTAGREPELAFNDAVASAPGRAVGR